MTFTSQATNDLYTATDVIDAIKELHAQAVVEREEFTPSGISALDHEAYDATQKRVEVFEDILEALSTEERIADLVRDWQEKN